jgi:hypothetical protein
LSVSYLRSVAFCSTIPEDGVPEVATRLVGLFERLDFVVVIACDSTFNSLEVLFKIFSELMRLFERHSFVFHEMARFYLAQLPQVGVNRGRTRDKATKIGTWTIVRNCSGGEVLLHEFTHNQQGICMGRLQSCVSKAQPRPELIAVPTSGPIQRPQRIPILH